MKKIPLQMEKYVFHSRSRRLNVKYILFQNFLVTFLHIHIKQFIYVERKYLGHKSV